MRRLKQPLNVGIQKILHVAITTKCRCNQKKSDETNKQTTKNLSVAAEKQQQLQQANSIRIKQFFF